LPAISGPNTLVIRFPPAYTVSRDRCQDPEKIARIEQLLQQVVGRKCTVRVELGGVPSDSVAAAADAEVPANSQTRLPSPRDEAAEPPVVQWAKDLLGAKLLKVDPGFGAVAPPSVERADPADAEEI